MSWTPIYLPAGMRNRRGAAILNPVGLRLVVVDDNQIFLAAARRLLTSEGAEIVGVASSSDEAMSNIASSAPDLVVVDLALGREDGLELARRIAALHHAPVVVLTSSRPAADLDDLIAASPAVGFVAKARLSVRSLDALYRRSR